MPALESGQEGITMPSLAQQAYEHVEKRVKIVPTGGDTVHPAWSIEGELYFDDDPENVDSPQSYWYVSVGHDNIMPWTGASCTFKTENITRVETMNVTPVIEVS